MTPWMIFSALALGSAVGVLSGMVGAGGNVVLIPALVFVYGMSQKTAQGTSLATMLLPITLLAFWRYHRAGQVNFKLAMVLAVGFAIGGYFGGAWAQGFSDLVLRRAFAVLLLALAMKLMLTR